MKNQLYRLLALAFLTLFFPQESISQKLQIHDVFIIPPHPSVGDTIYVVTDMLLPSDSEQLMAEWEFTDSSLKVSECYYISDNDRSEDLIDTLMIGAFEPGDYFLEFEATGSSVDFDCIGIEKVSTSIVFEVGDLFEFEDNTHANVNVFPNPSRDGKARISHGDEIDWVEVYEPNGLRAQKFMGSEVYWLNLDLLLYPAGDYRLRIKMKDGDVINRRFVRL